MLDDRSLRYLDRFVTVSQGSVVHSTEPLSEPESVYLAEDADLTWRSDAEASRV